MTPPPLSALGEIARKGDPERFAAAIFATEERRETLYAIIAFNLELAKIPPTVSEPMLGEIRLQWWRDAVNALGDTGETGSQEIIAGIAPVVSERSRLLDLIDARSFELGEPAEHDEASLDQWLLDTGGAMSALQVAALGGEGPALDVAAEAGWAEGAGRLIEALPALYEAGLSPIPVAKLDRSAIASGRTPRHVKKAVQMLARRALDRLEAARKRFAEIPKDARAPLLSLREAERRLQVWARGDGDLFIDTSKPSPFRAKSSMLFRAMFGRM
ncbi:MAG: squalene/phytoene synthase family protein [Pseudomonadota bacterium]